MAGRVRCGQGKGVWRFSEQFPPATMAPEVIRRRFKAQHSGRRRVLARAASPARRPMYCSHKRPGQGGPGLAATSSTGRASGPGKSHPAHGSLAFDRGVGRSPLGASKLTCSKAEQEGRGEV
ncbi:hypothetical protein TgHK011_007296 [Trichoderma gracile]|nr:hypothetical protein TgHK011_007296 [Trichoderma gracile]